MQGDFEKQVRQKMEELNLTPSAPVWEKVEWQIRPQQRRWRVLYWVLPAMLLLGGWWYVAKSPVEKESASQPVRTPSPLPGQSSTVADERKSPAAESSLPAEKLLLKQAESIPAGAKQERQGDEPLFRPVKTAATKNRILPFGRTGNRESAQAGNTVPADPEQGSTASVKPDPLHKQEDAASKAGQPSSADTAASKSGIEGEPKPPAATDSGVSRKKIAAAKKAWKKQVLLQAGMSDFAGMSAANVRADYTNSAPLPSTGSSQNTAGAGPGTVSRGLSFAVGFGLAKELNSRLQLTVGLQYAYYSVKSRVGAYRRIDTAVTYANSRVDLGGYYSSSASVVYTTSFHVLEVPVSVGYKLFKNVPLQLSAGASYGRLLKTTALTYQPQARVYFYNRENNNQNFLNLSAGLHYRFVQGAKFSVAAGPQVQYSATPVQKQPAGARPRLFFAGIKSSINF